MPENCGAALLPYLGMPLDIGIRKFVGLVHGERFFRVSFPGWAALAERGGVLNQRGQCRGGLEQLLRHAAAEKRVPEKKGRKKEPCCLWRVEWRVFFADWPKPGELTFQAQKGETPGQPQGQQQMQEAYNYDPKSFAFKVVHNAPRTTNGPVSSEEGAHASGKARVSEARKS